MGAGIDPNSALADTTLPRAALSASEGMLDDADGPELYTRHWGPQGNPRAIVVIVHGIAEHGGRYAHVGEYLARHGYAAYSADLRGHGLSEGPSVYVDTFDEYVLDVSRVIAQARRGCPAVPTFVLGHSMGGTIAVLLAIDRPGAIDGLILSAPAVQLGADVPPWLV